MGLTPAPLNLWPLSWIVLAPLWIALQTPNSKLPNTLILSALWGLGFHGTALSWITDLHPLTWLGIPWWGSVAIALFAWISITVWGITLVTTWALSFTSLQRWCRLGVGGRVLVGTALWCGWGTLWNLSPLDWTTLAFTQSPHNLAILHLGQVSGPTTITAAIVAANGLLAEALRYRSRKLALVTIAGVILVHLLGYTLYQQPLREAPAEALKVGIIQGNIPTREKLTLAGVQQAYEVYLQGYRQLAAAGADAVLTPEGAIPEYWDSFTQERNAFYRAVQQSETVLWLGTFVPIEDSSKSADFHITQSLLALTPALTGRYNKVKLVPLGEYIPLQSVLSGVITRLSPIGTNMIPGNPNQVFDSGVGQAAVGICYDSAFSRLFQQQVASGGTFIITASNNDPYALRMMTQHHAQDVMRAIETDRWAVRGTNTGLSGIVNPHGQTTWMAAPNQTITHLETIYRRHTQTLYVKWGDWVTPCLIITALLWLGWRKITPKVI
jgi:apolipoprotein N-acyltransferase